MVTKIKELRTQRGMTQQQLADLVHVSSRTIISIEKGVTVEELCCLEENLKREDAQ